MSTCDYCGTPLRGPRAGISYSHIVDAEGTPLSSEPLPESKSFCNKDCLDRWDEGMATCDLCGQPIHAFEPCEVKRGVATHVSCHAASDDGTCRERHPGSPGVLCGRMKFHHGMHDSGYFGGVPHIWPKAQ